METLLILTYSSVCWLIFKIFKIPVNKWTLTTVVLGGVAMLGTMLAGMAYFHPASSAARVYSFTTPIVSNVRGRIIEVPVQANIPLNKGDVLCKIDPEPFQNKVDELTARLSLAQKRLEQTTALAEVSAGSKFDVEQYQTEVDSLTAKLDDALFNLDNTVVTAPTDGFVTQLRLRPGMMAVPLPLVPLMTFVHSDHTIFVAGFSQQPMQNIKVGNEAEVIFPGIPGRVFKAHVQSILPGLAEGQLLPDGRMMQVKPNIPEGLVPVFFEFEQDMSSFFLPAGTIGTAAVYSERWHHVTIVRRMLLRMKSWQNFARFH